MKRATKPISAAEILRVLREVEMVLMHNNPEGHRAEYVNPEGHRAEYVIAPEDFAVREIRGLRARLEACREAWFDPAGDGVDDERIDRATDLRRKNWRKP